MPELNWIDPAFGIFQKRQAIVESAAQERRVTCLLREL
jgi:hypothetical protein